MLLSCMLSFVCGCATPRGAVFEPLEEPLVWPPPPDRPRVAYVGSLESTADLKPGKNVFESIGAALFGEEDVRSMLTPFAIATDDDRAFICDTNAQLVHVFDLKERSYEQWTTDEEKGLAQPVGVAVAADGRVFVSDSVAGSIAVFAADGTFMGRIAGEHVERPCGLAFDHAAERLYVADAAAHGVVVLTAEGAPLTRIGQRGTLLGQFNYPTAVAVDSEGHLFVSDTLNFRVQVFNRDLQPIRQIGSKGDLPGYFAQPKGIALDGEDHLYVVDAHFEAVQIFGTDGQLLMTFGQEGRGPGQFWLPAGIHIDQQDRIWVADSYNRRVQVFQYLAESSP
jgi:DNA-binding beta-propeller fold protein YncE